MWLELLAAAVGWHSTHHNICDLEVSRFRMDPSFNAKNAQTGKLLWCGSQSFWFAESFSSVTCHVASSSTTTCSPIRILVSTNRWIVNPITYVWCDVSIPPHNILTLPTPVVSPCAQALPSSNKTWTISTDSMTKRQRLQILSNFTNPNAKNPLTNFTNPHHKIGTQTLMHRTWTMHNNIFM